MPNPLYRQHVISIADLSTEQLELVLHTALKLKAEPRGDLHTDAPFSLSQLAYAWNSEGSTNEWMLTATTSSASEAPMQAALNMYVVPREITRAISN